MSPGIYSRLPMEAYLKAPAVSSSLLQAIIDECPRAAWWRSWLNPKRTTEDSTPAQDVGTVAHEILLEGSSSCVAVIDPRDHPNEKGGGHATGWTNKSIKAARETALAGGKVPVFPETMVIIQAMVDAAREYIDSLRQHEPAVWAAFQPGGGESEVTVVWDDDGVLCRIRPDRVSHDRRIITDYKTCRTIAEPDAWGRTQLVGCGYYIGGAFYTRGVKAATGVTPDYVFLVQEQEPPFLCSLVGIEPAGRELGRRKVQLGLNTWRTCAKNNVWPSYPPRVAYPEMPQWELARFEAFTPEAHGIPYDPAKLFERRGGFEDERLPAV